MPSDTPPPAGRGEKLGLFRDSALIVLARIGGAVSALGFTMLLSRTMGSEGLGHVSVAISLAMVLALFCTSNIEAGGVRFMVRYIADGDWGKTRAFIRFSTRYVLAMSAATLVVVLAYKRLVNGTWPELHILIGIVAAPLLAQMRLGAGFAMGLSRPVIATLPRTFLRPAVFLAAVALWIGVTGTIAPLSAMVLFLVTIALVLLGQTIVVRGLLNRALADDSVSDMSDYRTWLKISLTLGLSVMYVEYSVYVAVLAGSLVLEPSQLALLDVALKIMALLKFGVTAINQVFMPKLSRAMAQDDQAALANWLAISGLMKLGVVVVALVAAFLIGRPVLGLFGEEFRAAYSLLLLLLLDPVCIAVFGPASNVVSFSKRPYALLPPLAAGLTVLIGGTALFGATWGLWGAGLAYVLARVCWLAWLAGYCIVKLGINPTIFSVFAWAKQRKG